MTRYKAIWPDGYMVVWRNLTWAEYRELRPLQSNTFLHPMDLAMEVYRVCRIEGPDPTVVPAGIPAFIARQQMENNPFSGEYQPLHVALNLARSVIQQNYLQAARAFIAAGLHYRIEEIDSWDADTFFLRLAQAEAVLGRRVEPQDPANPEVPRPNARQKTIQRVHERDKAAG